MNTPATLQSSTICDRAREELVPGERWLHWSIPDPGEAGTASAFDDVVAELDDRITALTHARHDTRE